MGSKVSGSGSIAGKWSSLTSPLEKAMATCSSTLAWRIPWTEEPGGLPSVGSHRVGHDWSDLAAAAAATSPQIKNDKIMYLAFPCPPHPCKGRHTPWILDLSFSCFQCPLQVQKGQGEKCKAEPGPIWILASQSTHPVLSPTWPADHLDEIPVIPVNCAVLHVLTAALLTLSPQQYYTALPISLRDINILNFLSLFSLSKSEVPKGEGTHLFFSYPSLLLLLLLLSRFSRVQVCVTP